MNQKEKAKKIVTKRGKTDKKRKKEMLKGTKKQKTKTQRKEKRE